MRPPRSMCEGGCARRKKGGTGRDRGAERERGKARDRASES